MRAKQKQDVKKRLFILNHTLDAVENAYSQNTFFLQESEYIQHKKWLLFTSKCSKHLK